MWIGSLPPAQIELFTRRMVPGGGWEIAGCRKVAARLNGTICDSTLADFEEDERSFSGWTAGLCAPASIVNVYTVLSAFAPERQYCRGRAPFVFGPVNILPQPDLPELSAVPSTFLYPFPFLFALATSALTDEIFISLHLHWTNFHPCLSRATRVNFPRSCVYFSFFFFFFFLYVSF